MKFIKTEDILSISKFRDELYQRFNGPLDAMWESLYIASSDTYSIENEHEKIGYCSIDSDKNLLQIFLIEGFNHLMDSTIKSLIAKKLVIGARLSSIEPVSFNASLFNSTSIRANTFCFKYSNPAWEDELALDLILVTKKDIPPIKAYFKNQIGFDDTFGYTENLVDRDEIYKVEESGMIIATSELRLSDSQPDFADLGVIVNKNYQGRGIASQVLRQQAQKAKKLNRQPICSTTCDNVASQKAINRAGFYCSHIIFDISFNLA